MTRPWDAIVIGGGPAGLTAGAYLSRAGRRTLLLERGAIGGKARSLESLENIPGFSRGISGRALMRRYWDQAKRWGLRYQRAEVVSLERKGSLFSVRAGNQLHQGLSILLCTGARFRPWNILGPGGPPVYDAAFGRARAFAGRAVAVVGGGEAAVHQSLQLSKYAKTVYLVCRGRSVRAIGLLQERIRKAPNVRVLPNSVLGPGPRGSVRLESKGAPGRRLPVAAVFALIGQEPELSLLRWSRRPAGLFVAGDARRGVVRQVAAAAGDGMRAAMECEGYLCRR